MELVNGERIPTWPMLIIDENDAGAIEVAEQFNRSLAMWIRTLAIENDIHHKSTTDAIVAMKKALKLPGSVKTKMVVGSPNDRVGVLDITCGNVGLRAWDSLDKVAGVKTMMNSKSRFSMEFAFWQLASGIHITLRTNMQGTVGYHLANENDAEKRKIAAFCELLNNSLYGKALTDRIAQRLDLGIRGENLINGLIPTNGEVGCFRNNNGHTEIRCMAYVDCIRPEWLANGGHVKQETLLACAVIIARDKKGCTKVKIKPLSNMRVSKNKIMATLNMSTGIVRESDFVFDYTVPYVPKLCADSLILRDYGYNS